MMRKSSLSSVLVSMVAAATLLGATLSSAGCDSAGGSGGGGGSGAGGFGLVGGSGGSGGTGGAGGAADPSCYDYSQFDGAAPMVSFQADVLPILQRSCSITTGCHGDPNMPYEDRPYYGPNQKTVATAADIAAVLGNIIDVPSYREPGMSRVAPGDPEHSFLLYKLDHTLDCSLLECAASNDCGSTMPQGNEHPLALDERSLFRRWIAQGANNN